MNSTYEVRLILVLRIYVRVLLQLFCSIQQKNTIIEINSLQLSSYFEVCKKVRFISGS